MRKILGQCAVLLTVLAFLGPVLVVAQGVERDVDGSPLPPGLKYRVFVHHPDAGKPAATSPSCTATVNDQVATYGSAGWHLTGPRTYYLNQATVPGNIGAANAYAAINGAWASWNAADANIVVSSGGNTSLKRAKFDGTHLVAWGSVPNNAIGVTYTWYYTSTGEQVESDTIFNSRLKWSYTPYATDCGGVAGTYDLGDIGIHEFGHWVGLDDLYSAADKDLTMYGYGFTKELKKDTLGLGDLLGAAAITP
ncbi:MAG: hypothetical protein WAP51_04075 [Candidatus Sungiibacteriota bacterium]